MKIKKKMKGSFKRIVSFVLALVLLAGSVPLNAATASAATTSVSLTSLGRKGTVSFGTKTKSGTWWQMHLSGKKAFCLDLGNTCHTGNKYQTSQTFHWDQSSGVEKHGYYARIIRWYVLDRKRSQKAFVMGQALIWSVAQGRNSESQLKDVIKQVKNNINLSPGKTVEELYKHIFEPSGNWEVNATLWKKTGNSKSYQDLLTVDADYTPSYSPKTLNDVTYYRQRITVLKKDEDGKGLGGIQFTLDAENLDDLYSFSMVDRDGTEENEADDDEDTSFSMTGYTRDSGRIAYRMTYRLQTMDYYYYPDSTLDGMTAAEKKAAKEYLTDELELEEGIDFASGMTKDGAEKLAAQETKELKNDISNTYTLTEDNTGSNKNIMVDPVFAKGVKITLKKADSWEKNADGVWPDKLEEIPSEYSKAYVTGVTNKYKKATINVVKVDKYSKDKKAHGDANLDGAQFQLYAEQACTNKATVYDSKGTAKTAGIYTVNGGKLTTDYLRSGNTYYLKEVKAPVGYTLSNDVLPVKADASKATAEYTSNLASVEFGNNPVLGKVAIRKQWYDADNGETAPENGATFQVYLKSKKSYDTCGDYERALIKTDEKGYGISGDLYYGTYIVHQVDSGDVDAIPAEDFEALVSEDGKTYTYDIDNKLFKAYLRIIKKDGDTEKQVLKAGTAYQIYKVTDKGEELVEQSCEKNGVKEKVDTFVTDETGEIQTVESLRSATYRIYEVEAADGLHISGEFIEVTVNRKADNYESYVDEDGVEHILITLTYTNRETYGKLALHKTGEMLAGWDAKKHEFIYEDKSLKGAVFEIYADGDIVTQDGQGDTWFKNGDKAATIVTGEKAEFTSDCNGICGQSVDEDGTVHITLPLGKYKVKEVETLYGYVFPEDNEWNLEFTWQNSKDEFVINSTEDTDEKGTMNVRNLLAKPVIELIKEDADSKEGIGGAVFGLYTANDIYNVDGVKIVDAGTELTTLVTEEDGRLRCGMALPLMDEAYAVTNPAVTASPAPAETGEPSASGSPAVPVPSVPALSGVAVTGMPEPAASPVPGTDDSSTVNSGAVTAGNIVSALNSGDYYLKELSVSDSYYLDEEPVPVHLEYKDADTKVISVSCIKENKQTTNEVDKLSAAGSKEIDGCELLITDSEGKKIVSWVSGDKNSVKVYVTEADGYVNIKTSFDENGNLHVGGLFHDMEYTLTETRPADGYVTADSITYLIHQTETEDGGVSSVVAVKQEDGSFSDREDDKTIMVDEQTKIRLIKLDEKTGQGLPGAKFTITDSEGNEVMKVVSTEDGVDITGKLAVGQTYTFTEVSAPKGYKTARPVKYTVKDTAEVQEISVTDERVPNTPPVPQTGSNSPVVPVAVLFLMAVGAAGFLFRRKKIQA